ncbi:hypothetical protein [Streptomyces sp. NPDC054958]
MPLVSVTPLPDYLTTPAVHHGALPGTGRSHHARSLVGRALTVLHRHGVTLATYTATGHCVTEGAHVEPQTLGTQINVILDLQLVRFDHLMNPSSHPAYPALRARRVAEVSRWPEFFTADGWQVRAVHDTTPGRLGYVLTPPAE